MHPIFHGNFKKINDSLITDIVNMKQYNTIPISEFKYMIGSPNWDPNLECSFCYNYVNDVVYKIVDNEKIYLCQECYNLPKMIPKMINKNHMIYIDNINQYYITRTSNCHYVFNDTDNIILYGVDLTIFPCYRISFNHFTDYISIMTDKSNIKINKSHKTCSHCHKKHAELYEINHPKIKYDQIYICHQCYNEFYQFKQGLIDKYLLLSQYLIHDVSILITSEIFNFYVDFDRINYDI
jgi:hypothetical protein